MKVFSSKRISDSSADNLKSKIQNLKSAGFFALALTLALGGAVAEAQQPAKVPIVARLGVFANAPRSEAFRQGLHDLSYGNWGQSDFP
jgi:hypothetical protein